jgi:hypothetical protein
MKSFVPSAFLVALASATLVGSAMSDEAPEPVRSLYTYLKLNLPDGWKIAYLGEAPGTEKWSAKLRFAFEVVRTEKVEIEASTISSPPPGSETSLEQLRLIVYPEGRRIAKGLGWRPFMYRHRHFSLREPYAGIGTYEIVGSPDAPKAVKSELDIVKKLILSSGKSVGGAVTK